MNMAKIEQLHHGYRLIIDRYSDNAGIPHEDMYRVSTFNNDNHYHDELSFTEDQWKELKDFVLKGADGLVSEPFYDDEIYKEFQPRFGGVNSEFKELCWAAWNSAFQYVNEKIRKAKV